MVLLIDNINNKKHYQLMWWVVLYIHSFIECKSQSNLGGRFWVFLFLFLISEKAPIGGGT